MRPPRFEYQLDGLPAAILPEPPYDQDAPAIRDGRVLVWVAGHTYRVKREVLRPLAVQL